MYLSHKPLVRIRGQHIIGLYAMDFVPVRLNIVCVFFFVMFLLIKFVLWLVKTGNEK